jgi:hypothetical protein
MEGRQMSSVIVDQDEARKALERAWAKLAASPAPLAGSIAQKIRQVLEAKDVTFKYILVTGLLGKLTNPQAHPRAIQVSSSLVGAYDARSLCHNVVVPFEKPHGNLFGLSNEPFVNKPARHPEHRKDNTQLRNKTLSAVLHDVLEHASKAAPAEVEAMLVECLRVGKATAASEVKAVLDVDSNLRHVLAFVAEFLKSTDGGSRLVAVAGAFVRLLSDTFEVKVYAANVSDTYAKTAGDIEVYSEGTLCAAYECKHRPITLNDIEHGIRKAKEKGAPDYCFLIASGFAAGEEKAIRARVKAASEEMDVSLANMESAAASWAVVMNPVRRSLFGGMVAEILRDEMRRGDVANVAAELWNSLEQ